MASKVNKNVFINGKRSSMRLEPEMWDAFRSLCLAWDIDHVELMKRAVATHTGGDYTSTVRMFLFANAPRPGAVAQETA